MYKIIANRAHDCYDKGDTIISGLDTYKEADCFASHHTYNHADAALSQDGALVTIVEEKHNNK